MALALPVFGALALGLVLGGRLGNLADLRLRATWLFYLAIAVQVVAFPFAVLPWTTDGAVATALWLVSYGLLILAAGLNARITGVPIVALGMCLNLAAIVANRGTMPVRIEAMRDAGGNYVTQANSTAMADPHLGWLVDRWAAPEWIPLANVFSIGDVVIAAGAVVIVLAGMGVRLPQLPKSSEARR
ncbi:MAG: DUF5317 domain-containing protein [Thermoleophilia bacterium]|nr:DUF5317 domain-containing protein [Thermoleophilia bacterium]MDH4340460.1 DUF5317 domain-containing protein [Thermoleophilia bacterium]MDH5281097.1 DUF5317 domain-containing protein [Thermoleophilia bacterium]